MLQYAVAPDRETQALCIVMNGDIQERRYKHLCSCQSYKGWNAKEPDQRKALKSNQLYNKITSNTYKDNQQGRVFAPVISPSWCKLRKWQISCKCQRAEFKPFLIYSFTVHLTADWLYDNLLVSVVDGNIFTLRCCSLRDKQLISVSRLIRAHVPVDPVL